MDEADRESYVEDKSESAITESSTKTVRLLEPEAEVTEQLCDNLMSQLSLGKATGKPANKPKGNVNKLAVLAAANDNAAKCLPKQGRILRRRRLKPR